MKKRGGDSAVRAVRAADAAWLRAFTERDLDAAAALCDARGSMLVPNTPIATGKRAIQKIIARGFAMPGYELDWRPDRAGVARSGELGYTSGKYRVKFKNAAGEMVFDKGKYLMVWKKQADGEWKVLFDMNNSDLEVGK
ncbi:MAG: DUF4440 domain-containing protein [Candidatus Acidiferrales bacterium]